jgi:predicted permease
VRLLAAETALLAMLGLAIGLGLAAGGLGLLRRLPLDELPRAATAALDVQVLGTGMVLTLLTMAACGVAPALALSQVNPAASLSANARGLLGGRRGARLRAVVVAVEVALAAVLLTGVGLLLRSVSRLAQVDPGFEKGHALTMDVMLPSTRYSDESRRVAFFRAFLEQTAALPGVVAVGANRYFPLRDRQFSNPIFIEGRPTVPGQEPVVRYGGITTGYFRAMGIPIVQGRDFTATEMWESGGAVIINETMARLLWPDDEPLGRRLKHGAAQPWLTIVGIAGDVRQRRIDVEPFPQIYVPYADYKHTTMSIAVRTAGDPRSVAGPIRAIVQRLDPSLPLFNVRTLQEVAERGIGPRRTAGVLLGLFALLALALAFVAVYGVTSHVVSRSQRDLAVRAALGATSARVAAQLVRQNAAPVAIGGLAGFALAAALARSISAVLFEVHPLDAATFAAAAASVIVVGLTACYVPARRAAREDPAVVLRQG